MKKQLIEKVLLPIKKAGYNAYFVGGCVRDYLSGLKPHDYDICTTATPQQLHSIFDKFSNISKNPTFIKLFIVSWLYPTRLLNEYTSLHILVPVIHSSTVDEVGILSNE